jgi:hypothetical protein
VGSRKNGWVEEQRIPDGPVNDNHAFSRFFVKRGNPRIIALVAAKHGLRSESLEA